MLRKLCVFTISVFFLAFLLDGLAEAGRMGGGRSFGSKPSYQRSAPAPTPQRDARPAQSQPQQGMARPGGLFGGFGGMLGGMVMGGLLGSLLFGGGMRGFGGGPGLLDILIIGGGLFLLFRYLRARRAASQSAGPMAFESTGYQDRGRETAGSPWGGVSAGREEISEPAPKIPRGFDVDEFMKGARAAYNRLQDSWNKRDLEDIRQFTSPEVWAEVKRQAVEDPAGRKTEIVLVKAQLLEANTSGGETVASVYFDVLMRENPDEERPKQVREVWHFSRNDAVKDSFWRLEGIQQLEE